MKTYYPHYYVSSEIRSIPIANNLTIKILTAPELPFPIFARAGHAFRLPTEADWQRVNEKNPRVKPTAGDDWLIQFQASYSLLTVCGKQRVSNPDYTTIKLANHVQLVTGIAVSEGAYLRAALLAGFKVSPAASTWRVNIERRGYMTTYMVLKYEFESRYASAV
jgi:hypothetical protein